MKNDFKTSKCAIIAILTFCLLFCISGTQVFAAMAEVTEDTPAATEDTTQELMPMKAQSCNYIHYEVTGYYSNGYVKSVKITTYRNGKEYDSYTSYFAQSGPESMPSFHGCPCYLCTCNT